MYNIIVDTDPSKEYEVNGLGRNMANILLIPILNSLPASFHDRVKYTNKSAGEVVKHKTTHEALETLYYKGRNKEFKNRHFLESFFHEIWFNTNNSKAVRNRLKLVKDLLSREIVRRSSLEEIVILSIASGSARAVVESIFSTKPKSNILAYFLDKNIEAIEYSKNLIKNQGSFEGKGSIKFNWIHDTANSFSEHIKESPDIVEMVGLLDYFDDKEVVRIFKNIFENLNPGGVMITSNIVDNAERRFLDKAIGWKMIYRNGEEFAKLASEAGFKKEDIRVIYEPLKVHVVIIASK